MTPKPPSSQVRTRERGVISGTVVSVSSRSPLLRKKTQNACQRCRTKKIKCSGLYPCLTCTSRSTDCIFDDGDRKVMVSERYLKGLRESASKDKKCQRSPAAVNGDQEPHAQKSQDPNLSPKAPILSSFPDSHHAGNDTTPAQVNTLFSNAINDSNHLNPLSSAKTKSFFVIDSSGRQRHPGYSSTWSFSWQIRSLLQDSIQRILDVQLIPEPEGGTYAIASMQLQSTGNLDIKLIPSRDLAEYLITTTLFHLGPVYHLFDKDLLYKNLDVLYAVDSRPNALPHLWLVQFFLLMAFGKLLLGRGASATGPPGTNEFVAAMGLLPSVPQMYNSRVLATEVLCLISLFLHSVDMRSAAYNYIGQAQRIALSIGMNRETPPGCLEESECEHRRRLWWTLYIIDRKLSMNMGCPSSIQDSNIDLSWPAGTFQGVSGHGLTLHIKVAALIGRMMTAAYALNGTINMSYMSQIQGVFETMAELALEFSGEFDLSSSNGCGISRAAATLHLLYYQCTIQATRCIMFLLIQQRISAPEIAKQRSVSDPVLAMIKTCVGAASTSLKLLSLLHDQDLIDPFLPYDLESTFSSAFILILATIAYPSLALDCSAIGTASMILTWMSNKGNVIARTCQRELAELQAMASEIGTEWNEAPFACDVPSKASDWLWNALDIEGVVDHNHDATSIDLIGPYQGLLEGRSLSNDIIEDMWFWGLEDIPEIETTSDRMHE